MIRKALICILLVALPYPAAQAKNANWSIGTAYTIPAKRYEVGVFQPLRYGLTERVELSSHALTAFLSPNLEVKVSWVDAGRWSLASAHSLNYPTPLLNVLACQGSGCILPSDVAIPHIIAGEDQLLLTGVLSGEHLGTIRLGIRSAFTFGANEMPTVDLPLLYTRLAHHLDTWTVVSGVDFDGPIWGDFHYSLDAEAWLMPEREHNLAIEHALLLSWRPSATFSLEAGYKYIWGEYPFGTDWHLLPLVDAQWAF